MSTTSSTTPENASSLAASLTATRSDRLTSTDATSEEPHMSSSNIIRLSNKQNGSSGGMVQPTANVAPSLVDSRNILADATNSSTSSSTAAAAAYSTGNGVDSIGTPLPSSIETFSASLRPTLSRSKPQLNSIDRKQHQHPVELSERDSIFATSYTVDDSRTVTDETSPSRAHDSSRDVTAGYRAPATAEPTKAASERRPPILTSRSIESGLKSTAAQAKVTTNGGTVKGSQYPSSKPEQFDKKAISPRLLPRSNNSYQLQMSPSRWHQPNYTSPNLEFITSPLEEQLGMNDTKPRQEHRIEAVLNDEPAPHGRSRKASHYLGIFKEKGKPSDVGAGSTKLSEPLLESKNESENEQQLNLDVEGESGDTVTPKATHEATADSSLQDKPYAPSVVTETSSQANSPLASLFSHRSSLTETEDEGVSNLGNSIEWRSADTAHGGLPIRLLQDIRNWKGIDKSSSSSKVSKSRASTDEVQSISPTSVAIVVSPELKPDADEEYEYSDKEHIASATYYPHEAPSPETAAQHKLLTEEEVRQGESALGPPAQPIDDITEIQVQVEDQAAPAYTLQSKDKIQYVNQESIKSERSSSKFEDRTRWSVVSVSSDTEYESGYDTTRSDKGYESAVTEAGDLTPTATPHAGAPFPTKYRKRPLKAVELKPYQHQVGGHTKVFSFSKQAICKQLNNRENVFYEVIERRHPELLVFMPKYLGVLNVNYKKMQQRKKSTKKKRDDASVVPKIKAEEATTTDSAMPRIASSHTRMISHSSGFDKVDDAIPQVVYANNMHIIPDNLFRHRLLAAEAQQRPATSDGVVEVDKTVSTLTGSSTPMFQKLKRPMPPQSLSSWGATMVNTQFKEKVLREVFSPPHIHHRQRGRTRRNRNDFRSLRGQPEEYSEFVEASDAAVFSPTDSTHGSNNVYEQALTVPGRAMEGQDEIKVGSAPHVGEKGLSRFATADIERMIEPTIKPQRTKSIRRRRSGGGLRRKQNEAVDGKRGAFEYYEDADIDPDKEDIFPMELPTQISQDSGAADVPKVKDAAVGVKVNGSSTTATTPSSQPANPLEAQQSPDERIEHFLLLEDLTSGMSRPCVLDLKMGTRQYGIDASKKKQQSQRQKCKSTTSQQLGVRLCGMQVWNARASQYTFEDKYAGRDIHAGREFQDALLRFLSDGLSPSSALRHIPYLLEKLSSLESIIVKLPGYRFYASSLLVLYDGDDDSSIPPKSVPSSRSSSQARAAQSSTPSTIDIRLVDFANCVTGEDKLAEDTHCPPKDRDGVDKGYIRGLRSLRRYLRGIWQEISEEQRAERGEFEKRSEYWRDEWGAEDGDISV